MADALSNLRTVGSGSYATDDVQFLLQPVQMDVTQTEEKERLIQSRQKHYSEMIGLERAPTGIHHGFYTQALAQNGTRMAMDVQALALALNRACSAASIVLVSFVRAGLPLGVLLRRALSEMGRDVWHYGISIVRDRGIDRVALEAIIQAHGAESIVFVDGWTGKGAISGEIKRSLNADSQFPAEPRLVVLADPGGWAWLAASAEDWLIPSGILGATVSGLVSRSIWPSNGGLHGCVVYEGLREHDVSREFIADIDTRRKALARVAQATPWTDAQRVELHSAASYVVDSLAAHFSVAGLNQIKPGIAEATRAVLRRVPEHVLVQDRNDSDVQLLMHLSERAGVRVEEMGSQLGPYRAVTIIRGMR